MEKLLQNIYFISTVLTVLTGAIAWLIKREFQFRKILSEKNNIEIALKKITELEILINNILNEIEFLKVFQYKIENDIKVEKKSKFRIIDMLSAVIHHLDINIEEYLKTKKQFDNEF